MSRIAQRNHSDRAPLRSLALVALLILAFVVFTGWLLRGDESPLPGVSENRDAKPSDSPQGQVAVKVRDGDQAPQRSTLEPPLGTVGGESAPKSDARQGEFTLKIQDVDGNPLPGITVSLSGEEAAPSWVTGKDGTCGLSFVGEQGPRAILRKLPFEVHHEFRWDEAPSESRTRVVTMNDVGYLRVHPVDAQGVSCAFRGKGLLALASSAGSEESVSVDLKPGTLVAVPLKGPPLRLTGTSRDHGARGRETVDVQAPAPGPIPRPGLMRFTVESPYSLLRGRLPVLGGGRASVAAGERSRKTFSSLELSDEGRFEYAVPPFLPSIRRFQLGAIAPDGGDLLQVTIDFEPPLPPGIHELGLLQPDDVDVLVSGRIVDQAGLPVEGQVVKVVSGRTLEQNGGSWSLNGILQTSMGWSTAASGLDGAFQILGTTDIEHPVLFVDGGWGEHHSLAPVAFSRGDRSVRVRVGRAAGVRAFLNAMPENQYQDLALELWSSADAAGPSYVEDSLDKEVHLVAVPGHYLLRLIRQSTGELVSELPGWIEAPPDGFDPYAEGVELPIVPEWLDVR